MLLKHRIDLAQISFLQSSFMNVKPRIISEQSRCLLVVFRASLENFLVVNKLAITR